MPQQQSQAPAWNLELGTLFRTMFQQAMQEQVWIHQALSGIFPTMALQPAPIPTNNPSAHYYRRQQGW